MDEPRTVVITGVTRGIGRGLTEEFAAQGHTVLGCGRNRAHIDELQRDLAAPHDFRALDVAHEDQVASWARDVLESHSAPDTIINNAALINTPAPLWQVAVDEFSELIDVNVKGVTWVIRHFVPAMIERGNGVIVNLSSGWGRSTSPEVAPYCASKWAIEGLTQALAQELPADLTAVALSPGTVATDMLAVAFGYGPAALSPSPEAWSRRAVPYILGLDRKDNGRSLTISG